MIRPPNPETREFPNAESKILSKKLVSDNKVKRVPGWNLTGRNHNQNDDFLPNGHVQRIWFLC